MAAVSINGLSKKHIIVAKKQEIFSSSYRLRDISPSNKVRDISLYLHGKISC